MSQIQVLLDTVIQYLNHQMRPIGFWKYFITNFIPLLNLLLVFGGVYISIRKYYHEKNKEAYEKILKEVYAPLYNYLIKQELFCKLYNIERDIKSAPILEVTSTKQTQKISFDKNISLEEIKEKTVVLGLNRENFIKMLNNVNIALASKELYTLLSLYEVTCHIENEKNDGDGYCNATLLKVKIEYEIRKEILTGYYLYHNKLSLDKSKVDSFCKIENEDIVFTYEIDKSEVDKLKKDMRKNVT